MSLPPQHAALLATIAVLWISFFPSGTGPFSATYGPATAVSAIACDILDFACFQGLLGFLILLPTKYLHYPVWAPSLLPAYRPPRLALRC